MSRLEVVELKECYWDRGMGASDMLSGCAKLQSQTFKSLECGEIRITNETVQHLLQQNRKLTTFEVGRYYVSDIIPLIAKYAPQLEKICLSFDMIGDVANFSLCENAKLFKHLKALKSLSLEGFYSSMAPALREIAANTHKWV